MTVKQPAIAARNTKANERLLSAIFSPHDKAGILLPRCKTLKRIRADKVGRKRFVARNRVNGLALSLIPSSNCSFDANLPLGTLASGLTVLSIIFFQTSAALFFCRNMVCLHRRHPPALSYRICWLGGIRGTVMTFLLSISLLSIGASFGFVIAGILNKSDVET